MLILLELCSQFVATHWRNVPLIPQTHRFVAVTEGSRTAVASVGDIIEAVTAELSEEYSILPWFLKRSVLGKENFCLEVELLRLCLEVSSSAMSIMLYYKQ